MSKFSAFLKTNVHREKTKKIYISDAFKDENGDLVPFVIRTLSATEEARIRKETTIEMENGPDKLDTQKYDSVLIPYCIVEPDLKSTELQNSYGVIGEYELLKEMLLAGELAQLYKEISEFNGFKNYKQKVEEAKN